METTRKISPARWGETHQVLTTTSLGQRAASQDRRQETARLTRQTSEELLRSSRAAQHELSTRLDEIEQRKADLRRAVEETFDETGSLLNQRDVLEQELRAKELPTEIVSECCKYRDSRYGVDLVDDNVDRQLDTEAALIVEVKGTLKGCVEQATEQIRLLRAATHALEVDMRDKYQASDIDRTCAALDVTSRHVGLFADTLRIDDRALAPADWHDYTQSNIDIAAAERTSSIALRDQINKTLKDTSDRLLKQANTVEDAFNTRLAEMRQKKSDAEVHLAETRTEISAQERALQEIEDAIVAKQAPLKVAHTRLKNRAGRPNVELVNDPAQKALLREVADIEAAIALLEKQHAAGEQALRALNRAALALEEDVACKANSINIDNRCMQRRQQYKYRTL